MLAGLMHGNIVVYCGVGVLLIMTVFGLSGAMTVSMQEKIGSGTTQGRKDGQVTKALMEETRLTTQSWLDDSH